MTEKEENPGGNFLDYVYYIGAALLFIFIIYLIFSNDDAAPGVLGLMPYGQEYRISSAFGIAK